MLSLRTVSKCVHKSEKTSDKALKSTFATPLGSYLHIFSPFGGWPASLVTSTSSVYHQTMPPRKRIKTSKAATKGKNSQCVIDAKKGKGRAPITSRKALGKCGGLAGMPDMPLDILFEVRPRACPSNRCFAHASGCNHAESVCQRWYRLVGTLDTMSRKTARTVFMMSD